MLLPSNFFLLNGSKLDFDIIAKYHTANNLLCQIAIRNKMVSCMLQSSSPLTYIITFDNERGSFSARSTLHPHARGEGKCLFAAIDHLESSLDMHQHKDELKLNFIIGGKHDDKVELTAKMSIIV